MEECAPSVISKKKITHSLSKYVWESPILKAMVYNPFILAMFMLLVIWILDFLYGKKFKKNQPSIVAQHMITTYIILSCAFAMNNIIIKHKYRMERIKKDDDYVEMTETIV
jgi:hypothetical protein